MSTKGDHRVTRLLTAIGAGDNGATDELFPLVYEDLRALARRRMRAEPPGHTLQATALVHEAYLRLVGDGETNWNSRGHFYAAAAQAMRRILVERARRYQRQKHGGGRKRLPLDQIDVGHEDGTVDVLALNEALEELQRKDLRAYDVAMLRHFCGLTNEDTAQALGISPRTVRREWDYARVWLFDVLKAGGPSAGAEKSDG